MAQFDDIPIHQLHKADGYQIRNLDEEEDAGGIGARAGPGQSNQYATESSAAGYKNQEEELKNMSLRD